MSSSVSVAAASGGGIGPLGRRFGAAFGPPLCACAGLSRPAAVTARGRSRAPARASGLGGGAVWVGLCVSISRLRSARRAGIAGVGCERLVDWMSSCTLYAAVRAQVRRSGWASHPGPCSLAGHSWSISRWSLVLGADSRAPWASSPTRSSNPPSRRSRLGGLLGRASCAVRDLGLLRAAGGQCASARGGVVCSGAELESWSAICISFLARVGVTSSRRGIFVLVA